MASLSVKWAQYGQYSRAEAVEEFEAPGQIGHGREWNGSAAQFDGRPAHHSLLQTSKATIGTHQRVWLDVLLYTGLRRGDAVRLGRQHVRDGVATLKTEKGAFTVTVTLPILSVLSATLTKGPCGELTFICGANGKPLTKETFGNEFRAACRAAGIPGSAHGVRKIAATRAANAGATVAQLEAIFGWQGGSMASLYTREADRRRLALEAMHKLDVNDKRTSIVAPFYQVRHSEKKDQ